MILLKIHPRSNKSFNYDGSLQNLMVYFLKKVLVIKIDNLDLIFKINTRKNRQYESWTKENN